MPRRHHVTYCDEEHVCSRGCNDSLLATARDARDALHARPAAAAALRWGVLPRHPRRGKGEEVPHAAMAALARGARKGADALGLRPIAPAGESTCKGAYEGADEDARDIRILVEFLRALGVQCNPYDGWYDPHTKQQLLPCAKCHKYVGLYGPRCSGAGVMCGKCASRRSYELSPVLLNALLNVCGSGGTPDDAYALKLEMFAPPGEDARVREILRNAPMRALQRFAIVAARVYGLPDVALKKRHTSDTTALVFYTPNRMVAFSFTHSQKPHDILLDGFLDGWRAAAELTLRAARALFLRSEDAQAATHRHGYQPDRPRVGEGLFPCGADLTMRLRAVATNNSQALLDLLDAHAAHGDFADNAALQRLCDRVRALNCEMVGWAEEEITDLPFTFLIKIYRDALRCCWVDNVDGFAAKFRSRARARLQEEAPSATAADIEGAAEQCAQTCVLFMAARMQPEVPYRPRFRDPEDRPFVLMPEWVTDDAEETPIIPADKYE